MWARLLKGAMIAAAFSTLAACACVMLSRMTYPFELAWM